MKKHLLNKTLLRKLEGKKSGKIRRTLEKKVRTSLTEQARNLVKDLHTAEIELAAMRAHAPGDWLWLADIRHARYLMNDVLEVLAKGAEAPPQAATLSDTQVEDGIVGAHAPLTDLLIRQSDFSVGTRSQELNHD